MAEIQADAQEILDWMHYWIWAVDSAIPQSTRDLMLANIKFFEAGGRFEGATRKSYKMWVELKEMSVP